eukprot:230805-Chlamydomonas_euryale.AAC.1
MADRRGVTGPFVDYAGWHVLMDKVRLACSDGCSAGWQVLMDAVQTDTRAGYGDIPSLSLGLETLLKNAAKTAWCGTRQRTHQ